MVENYAVRACEVDVPGFLMEFCGGTHWLTPLRLGCGDPVDLGTVVFVAALGKQQNNEGLLERFFEIQILQTGLQRACSV